MPFLIYLQNTVTQSYNRSVVYVLSGLPINNITIILNEHLLPANEVSLQTKDAEIGLPMNSMIYHLHLQGVSKYLYNSKPILLSVVLLISTLALTLSRSPVCQEMV